MTEVLPLFPLGTVLYPGLVLPLHIFEERYRQLMRDLLDGLPPRRFGVIAIREGRETGVTGVSSLHEVGCLALLREANELDDGRYEIVTVGTDRFRLRSLNSDRPYLRGEVELLDEPVGPGGFGLRSLTPARPSRGGGVELRGEPVGAEAETSLVVPAVRRAFRG